MKPMCRSFRPSRLLLAAAFAVMVGLAGAQPSLAQQVPEPQQVQLRGPAAEGPASVADLAERLLDAVVNVSTAQNVGSSRGQRGVPPPDLPEMPDGAPFEDFFDEFFSNPEGMSPQRVQSLGSGFIIDAEEGIVVTNNHVITGADEIEINFADGGKLKAELIGVDTKTDLAVLKVDPTLRPLKEVPFGNSEEMRIGDWVMAIGNPFGLGGSVSMGIVSARGRDINSGPYDDFIQTDAAINRGNSGGPLFNMNGEVIGINTAIISPSGGSIGIGFAIPSSLAVPVIDQLREFGETRRGWLGVRIQPVTEDIAESLGLDRAEGALVAGVVEGGPVSDGTIQPGDIIVEFDGTRVVDMRDLPRIVAESPVGEEVEVTVVRKGEEQTVTVTLGRLEDGEQLASAEETPAEEAPDGEAETLETAAILGLTLAELDESARTNFGIAEDVSGVVITEVAENSAAAEKGIIPGDVITEIAQESVSTPADVLERIETLKGQGRRNALLMLASKTGELRFVTLRMD